MTGEKVSASPAGFAAAPRIGFAAHMPTARNYGSYAPVTHNYGSHAPATGGFAEALQRGREQLEAEQTKAAEKADKKSGRRKPKKPSQPLEGDTYPATVESTGRKPQRKPAHSRISLPLEMGRRVIYDRKGSDWDSYGKRLMEANPGYADSMSPIQPNRLILNYLSSDQAQEMFARRLGKERFRSTREERKRMRELRDKFNGCIDQQVGADLDQADRLYQENPEFTRQTIERQMDPDNPKWRRIDKRDAKIKQRGARIVPMEGLWLAASFEVADALDSSAPDRLSVTFKDTGSVLANSRNRFVDMLGDNGFDVSDISEDWRPQLDLVELTGGLTVDRLEGFRVPGFPLMVPLDTPQVYENRR